MRINDITTRLKLLILCIFAISVPIAILSIINYRTHEAETYDAVRSNLQLVVNDWKVITESYIEQEKRVLKREEVLIKQRLETILLDVIKMLEISTKEDDRDTSPEVFNEVYSKIASIKIGRSGHVSLIDADDKYVILKGKEYSGENVFSVEDEIDNPHIQEILENTRKLNSNTTHFFTCLPEKKDCDPRYSGIQAARCFDPLGLVAIARIYDTDFKSYELNRLLKDELKQEMAEQKIGQNGYLWVINSIGEYVISKDLLRDGENVWNARDKSGNYITQEVISGTKKLGEGETFFYRYFWKNIGEKEPQERLSAFMYIPEWDWIIGASAYYKDFNSGLRQIRYQIIFISFISILISSFVAYYFALLISKPIRELQVAQKIARLGSWKIDVQKNRILWSDELFRIFGMDQQETQLTHDMFLERIYPEDRSDYNKVVKKLATEGKADFEFRLVRSDGEIRWVSGQGATFFGKNGVPVTMFGTMQDITKRKETEEELRKHREHLEELVDERTKELRKTHEKLSRSERFAALGKMAGMVAHELRNPLGVIKNSVYFLKMKLSKEMKEEKTNRHLVILEEEVDISDRIITDILTYGRLKEPKMSKVNLNKVINQAIERIKIPSNIILDFKLEPDLDAIMADENQLMLVFTNVILNATEAMPKGGRLIIATFAKNKFIEIKVKDEGMGIPEEDLPKIFDPDYSSKSKGTGLGLAICQSIVSMHNGEINVQSELNKGTEFVISLPVNN